MEWNGLEWNHGMEWSGMDLSGVTFGRFWVKKTPFQNVVLSGRAKKPKIRKIRGNFFVDTFIHEISR